MLLAPRPLKFATCIPSHATRFQRRLICTSVPLVLSEEATIQQSCIMRGNGWKQEGEVGGERASHSRAMQLHAGATAHGTCFCTTCAVPHTAETSQHLALGAEKGLCSGRAACFAFITLQYSQKTRQKPRTKFVVGEGLWSPSIPEFAE